jgi:hypothetical protein
LGGKNEMKNFPKWLNFVESGHPVAGLFRAGVNGTGINLSNAEKGQFQAPNSASTQMQFSYEILIKPRAQFSYGFAYQRKYDFPANLIPGVCH